MADNFHDILREIVSGLQDGILGTLKIRKLGKAESEEILKKDPEPMTTLARRRAERNKDKVQNKEREPKIIQRIIMCCAWNGGIFLMSIFLFNHMLLPIVQLIIAGIFGGSGNNSVWGWIGPILSWTFSALWILPIFVLSKVVNSLWFQDIADAAYFQYRGKPKQFNISSLIADISFSMLLQAFFLIQGTLFMFLPIPAVGQIIGHIHMALLYSLYAFEYKWLNMGWEVHKRLSHIENYWPYFFGFGLPMAVMTSLHPSVVISGCIFSILFPVFIISANEAVEPTRVCSFPLKLFAPVVALSNAIFRRATVGSGSTNISSSQSKPTVPPTGRPRKRVGISQYSQEYS